MDLEKLKYPIGKFSPEANFTDQIKSACIAAISSFPQKVKEAVDQLSSAQINAPYRPEGWTIHQLVHHCADSHMNAYCRFKLAMTEDTPTIKTYDQGAWAKTADVSKVDIQVSISLMEALHTRWSALLHDMSTNDFNRLLFHPELGKTLTLGYMLQLYGWHSNHHLAHIMGIVKPV